MRAPARQNGAGLTRAARSDSLNRMVTTTLRTLAVACACATLLGCADDTAPTDDDSGTTTSTTTIAPPCNVQSPCGLGQACRQGTCVDPWLYQLRIAFDMAAVADGWDTVSEADTVVVFGDAFGNVLLATPSVIDQSTIEGGPNDYVLVEPNTNDAVRLFLYDEDVTEYELVLDPLCCTHSEWFNRMRTGESLFSFTAPDASFLSVYATLE